MISPLSHLIGAKVTDVDGASVGHVLDLLVDKADGKVSYVKIRLDSSGQSVNDSLTIPWSTFLPDQKAGAIFRLRVHRAALGSLTH